MESVYLPVNLLIIKVCFRFLTFGSVQAKYLYYGVRVTRCALRGAGYSMFDTGN